MRLPFQICAVRLEHRPMYEAVEPAWRESAGRQSLEPVMAVSSRAASGRPGAPRWSAGWHTTDDQPWNTAGICTQRPVSFCGIAGLRAEASNRRGQGGRHRSRGPDTSREVEPCKLATVAPRAGDPRYQASLEIWKVGLLVRNPRAPDLAATVAVDDATLNAVPRDVWRFPLPIPPTFTFYARDPKAREARLPVIVCRQSAPTSSTLGGGNGGDLAHAHLVNSLPGHDVFINRRWPGPPGCSACDIPLAVSPCGTRPPEGEPSALSHHRRAGATASNRLRHTANWSPLAMDFDSVAA
jgi:hypothetical protein